MVICLEDEGTKVQKSAVGEPEGSLVNYFHVHAARSVMESPMLLTMNAA